LIGLRYLLDGLGYKADGRADLELIEQSLLEWRTS